MLSSFPMNEIIFFLQVLVIIIFSFKSLRIGKGALFAWICIQAIIANLFVLKQITLFGFNVTASDAFAIGSLLGLNLLQEYFSKEDAQEATRICFYFMIFFALISQLHLLYQPSSHDTSHSAFHTILSVSPRLFGASLFTFFVVQRVDIYIFSFLKKFLYNTSFSIRAGISLVFSQLLDTILFSFIGLYGLVVSTLDIILISFLVKLIVIGCFSTYIRLSKA